MAKKTVEVILMLVEKMFKIVGLDYMNYGNYELKKMNPTPVLGTFV